MTSVAGTLRHAGYRVVVAKDGFEAVALHRKERPDLILLDVGMPKMNGREACKDIRQIDSDVPILLYTAFDKDVDQVRRQVADTTKHDVARRYHFAQTAKNVLNARAGVGHDSKVGDFANIAPGVSLSGHTTIGEDVFMGTNSCTAPGMTVGKGATVACGTPVLKNVEPGATLSPFGTLKA